MVLPGHLAGGYLATTLALELLHPGLSTHQFFEVTAIGTLAGEGPDIDLAIFYIDQTFHPDRVASHRDYLTHAPLAWLVFSLAIAAVGFFLGSTFIEWIGWAVLAGSWSHLILDSIEDGVMWLWPFSTRRLYLFESVEKPIAAKKGTLTHYWIYVTRHYAAKVTFYVEIAITLVAVVVFYYSHPF